MSPTNSPTFFCLGDLSATCFFESVRCFFGVSDIGLPGMSATFVGESATPAWSSSSERPGYVTSRDTQCPWSRDSSEEKFINAPIVLLTENACLKWNYRLHCAFQCKALSISAVSATRKRVSMLSANEQRSKRWEQLATLFFWITTLKSLVF